MGGPRNNPQLAYTSAVWLRILHCHTVNSGYRLIGSLLPLGADAAADLRSVVVPVASVRRGTQVCVTGTAFCISRLSSGEAVFVTARHVVDCDGSRETRAIVLLPEQLGSRARLLGISYLAHSEKHSDVAVFVVQLPSDSSSRSEMDPPLPSSNRATCWTALPRGRLPPSPRRRSKVQPKPRCCRRVHRRGSPQQERSLLHHVSKFSHKRHAPPWNERRTDPESRGLRSRSRLPERR